MGMHFHETQRNLLPGFNRMGCTADYRGGYRVKLHTSRSVKSNQRFRYQKILQTEWTITH